MNKTAMAAAVSVILAGGAHAAQQERPNVIVIIADDMATLTSALRRRNPHPQPAGDGRAGDAHEPVLHLADVGPGAFDAAHR